MWLGRKARLSHRQRGVLGSLARVRLILVGNPPELEVLIAMAMTGDRLKGFPLVLRSRALCIAPNRFRSENIDAYKVQTDSGIIAGAVAGFAWCMTVGAASLLFCLHLAHAGVLNQDVVSSLVGFTAGLLVMLLASLLGGAIFGGLSAWTVADDVIRRKSGFRPFRFLRSKLIALNIVGVSLALAAEPLWSETSTSIGLMGYVSVSLLVFAAIVVSAEAATALAMRSSLGFGRLGLWVWSVLAGAGFPFCGYVLFGFSSAAITGKWPTFAAFVFAEVGAFVTVAAVARGVAARKMATARGEGRARGPRRAARTSSASRLASSRPRSST